MTTQISEYETIKINDILVVEMNTSGRKIEIREFIVTDVTFAWAGIFSGINKRTNRKAEIKLASVWDWHIRAQVAA